MVQRLRFAGGGSGKADTRSVNMILTDWRRFVNVVASDAERIMRGAGEIVLEETLPYVPTETGALRESGRVEVVRSSKGNVSAMIRFGGEDYPVSPTKNTTEDGIVFYAVMVHEGTEHMAGRKFLEMGGLAAEPRVDAYIRGELSKLL